MSGKINEENPSAIRPPGITTIEDKRKTDRRIDDGGVFRRRNRVWSARGRGGGGRLEPGVGNLSRRRRPRAK